MQTLLQQKLASYAVAQAFLDTLSDAQLQQLYAVLVDDSVAGITLRRNLHVVVSTTILNREDAQA